MIQVVFSLFIGCRGYSNSIEMETLEHNGETREYHLHIPNSYDGSSDVPLLFNFHGFGGTATDQLEWADMRSLAEEHNFILVYPQGTLLQGSITFHTGRRQQE